MIRLVFTSQNECFFLTVLMVCTVSKCTILKLFPYWWTATVASSRLSLMSFLLGIVSTNWSETRHRNVSYSSLPALKHSKAVRNLGIVLDGELSFNNRINKVTRTAFSDFKIYLTLENSYLNVINCCMCSYLFYLNLNASRNTTCWECFQELWSCYLWSCVCVCVFRFNMLNILSLCMMKCRNKIARHSKLPERL